MTQQMGVYIGRTPNPHVRYGEDDMMNAPTTFARIGTRWGDIQLSNGWMRTNWGRRNARPEAGFMIAVNQVLPGQTRLIGTHPGDFPMRGPSPSQWDYHVASSAGSQPNYPGGPGQIMGTMGHTGSNGG